MATLRVPLVGNFNQRGLDGSAALTAGQDQRFLNCTFDLVHNSITGKTTIYVMKRPGWGVDSEVASGSASTALLKPQTFSSTISAFGDTNSTIYFGTTSVGTITGKALHLEETTISGVDYVMIKSSDGTGWYYADGAKDDLTYTMDGNNSTTVTDIKISGVNSTAGLYPGQKLTAASNIPAGTRIVSVDSAAFTAVLDTATTGGAFNDLSVTKEPVAKITSANFVTTFTNNISGFAEMDGYLFYATDNGKVYNSNLNSVTNYTALDFLTPNMSTDVPIAIIHKQDKIIVFGANSKEVFYDVGNPSGSPLQRIPSLFEHVGVLDQRSITDLEDSVYFVSSPYGGDIGVYRMQNDHSVRISTPQIDRILGNVSTTGGAIYTSSFRMGGYPYLTCFLSLASDGSSSMLLENADILLLETGDQVLLEESAASSSSYVRTLVYNIDLKIWSEWDCDEATFIDSVASGTSNQIIATSRVLTTGKIYTIFPASQGQLYQDNGSSYTMSIRTSKLDFGTSKRKRIKSIRLICDSDLTGTAYLSWSDDDFVTWSTPRAFDLTSKEPKLSNCGSHKGGRSYLLTHSSNSAFRAEALEIEYESEDNKVPGKPA